MFRNMLCSKARSNVSYYECNKDGNKKRQLNKKDNYVQLYIHLKKNRKTNADDIKYKLRFFIFDFIYIHIESFIFASSASPGTHIKSNF